jgi:hypothetical protein
MKPKFIEQKNLPGCLWFEKNPEFCIYKIEIEGNDIRLFYTVEDRGESIYSSNYQKFERLPSKIEVISGGWYGNKGRWSPLARFQGTIICENVRDMKQVSNVGADYKFKVRKIFLSTKKILTVESEKVGIVEIKCVKIIPQPFDVYLFDKEQNKWILRSLFDFDYWEK